MNGLAIHIRLLKEVGQPIPPPPPEPTPPRKPKGLIVLLTLIVGIYVVEGLMSALR